jgi:hypothetical protein
MANQKLEGALGNEPPPNAPREVTQPLSPDLIAQQRAQAQSNERELPPFNPQPVRGIKPPDVPLVKAPRGPAPVSDPTVEFFDEPAAHVAHQPAASNTDSPSRGMPRPQAPDKAITGGWGNISDSYEPLNGAEVRATALLLADELVKILDNDLRFTLASTYPRVEISLELKVNSYLADQPLVIRRQRREFNERDESETPANAMRAEIGSEPPRKQAIDTPGGRMFVDVTS